MEEHGGGLNYSRPHPSMSIPSPSNPNLASPSSRGRVPSPSSRARVPSPSTPSRSIPSPSTQSSSTPKGSMPSSSTPPSRPQPSPSGTRGNLASQPGLESESLSDMSVRGLDLLKYAQISSDGSYRCLECDKMQILKSFKNKYSFQRHAFLYHEGKQRKVFPCPVCLKEFSRPDKMKQHLKQVHDCIIPKTETLPSPSHFIINPYLGLEDHPALESKVNETGNEMFKLMSRLVGHGHMTSPGGQGAS